VINCGRKSFLIQATEVVGHLINLRFL